MIIFLVLITCGCTQNVTYDGGYNDTEKGKAIHQLDNLREITKTFGYNVGEQKQIVVQNNSICYLTVTLNTDDSVLFEYQKKYDTFTEYTTITIDKDNSQFTFSTIAPNIYNIEGTILTEHYIHSRHSDIPFKCEYTKKDFLLSPEHPDYEIYKNFGYLTSMTLSPAESAFLKTKLYVDECIEKGE